MKNTMYLPQVLLFFLCVCHGKKLAPYIKTCQRFDPNLDDCVLKNANEAMPFIVKGDPEYNQFPLNPLKIPLLEMKSNNLVIQMKDLKIHGFENAKVTQVHVDLEKGFTNTTLFVPNLRLESNYEMHGQLLVFPLEGAGTGNIEFHDGSYVLDLYWDLQKDAKGIEFMKPKDIKVDYTVKSVNFDLGEILKGNKEINDQLGKVLNENWNVLHDELKPSATEAIKKVCESILKNYLFDLSYDQIYPK